MRKFKIFKISCLLFAVLVACDKKDDELKVSTDVVFLKKKVSDEVRYGVSYYLQANQGLNEVTVTLPLGLKTVNLKQNEANTYLFEYEPNSGDFTNIAPEVGDYLFEVVSKKGERIEVTDEQRFNDLSFAVVESMDFDNTNLWCHVKWEKVSAADAYAVFLLKLSGEIVFSSFTIPASANSEYKISDFHITGAWSEKPQKDKMYILRIKAIKYDAAIGKDDFYNIQEISESDREIIWQLE